MLHRRIGGAIVGAGERVPHPFAAGMELIISRWERTPQPRKRKRDPVEYEVTVYAYRAMDGLNYVGFDGFQPYELGLYWSDTHEPPRPNRYKSMWKRS